ncbi:LAME_0G00386g1_1 [Lachancea meyersii CBS 8951]|uniref:LAME_0G00386g1_1 n=1 Tax=Lachancea meyersii CBS 8951 TaxID=1266667 RepID=A0A1G4K4P4_9SACH|nr:LAME_0G00386g1_1 [Lachancea meyersii CBS 8951]
MEFHSKRSRPAVAPASEPLPLKRRALNVLPSSPPLASRGLSHVPRTSMLLAKSGTNRKFSATSSDDSDIPPSSSCHMSFSKKPAVHFQSSPRVDPILLEAVARYSDTDNDFDNNQKLESLHVESENARENSHQITGSSDAPSGNTPHVIDTGYALEKRKSLSRHASFSSIGRKQIIPYSDSVAQERCFDYLLQSIDEVWARFCNETSTAEAKVYESMCKSQVCASESPTPFRDDSSAARYSNPGSPRYKRTLSFTSVNNKNGMAYSDEDSDETGGYKSEVTNPTEYETDCASRKISKLPDSLRLQSLKDRLCRAKNDLEGLHGSTAYEECARFWRRWDMIKYGAVEMMEEDDEDEVIESVIEELERGRCFTN